MQDSLAQVHIRREGVYPLYTNNYYPPGACITTTRSSDRVALDCDRRTRDQSCTIALNPLLCKRRGGKASSPQKKNNKTIRESEIVSRDLTSPRREGFIVSSCVLMCVQKVNGHCLSAVKVFAYCTVFTAARSNLIGVKWRDRVDSWDGFTWQGWRSSYITFFRGGIVQKSKQKKRSENGRKLVMKIYFNSLRESCGNILHKKGNTQTTHNTRKKKK